MYNSFVYAKMLRKAKSTIIRILIVHVELFSTIVRNETFKEHFKC